MPEISINTGVDFLFAHLHAWWAQSAQGERLEELTRCATEDNFFHQLQNLGIITIQDRQRVHNELIVRQYQRLGNLAALVGPREREYILALRQTLESENIKALLNYRFFPEREGHMSEALVRFPGRAVQEADLVAMLDAPTMEQFIRMLPASSRQADYMRITKRLGEDKNIMRAESAIDNLNFASELAAAARLPLSMRGVALELQRQEIDLTNVITLLRNANFYHLNADQLKDAWVAGGTEVPETLLHRLAGARNVASVIVGLPAAFAALLEPHEAEPLDQLENLLLNVLAQKARKCFYDASSPELAIPVYPLLLRFETVNLGRIYEGVRFSLPARLILAMMIQ